MSHDLLDLAGSAILILLLAFSAYLVYRLKLAASRLRQKRDFLGAVLNVAGALVMVLDRQGRIVRFNEACEVTSGYRHAEAIDRCPWDFLVPADAVESERAHFARLSAGHFPSSHENPWLTKDGRRRLIAWHATALTDPQGQVSHVIATGIDITERTAAEAALRLSEARFRALFEGMEQGVIYQDPMGRIIDANPAALAILGLGREQILGRDSSDPRWRCVHADGSDFPGDEHPTMVALRTGKPVRDVIMGLRDAEGTTYRWLLVNATPQFCPEVDPERPFQVFSSFSDVTERKRAQDALATSEARFRALVETSSDWIWEVDAAGRFSYSSPRVADLLGHRPEDMLGRTPFDFMPADEARRVAALFAGIASRKTGFTMLENTNLHRDGHAVVMESSAVPILDEHGELRGYRGVDRDISERKAAETTLRDYTRELENLHAKLDAEQSLARDIMDHMTRRHGQAEDCLTHWQQPSSTFNGDTLAMWRSPSGRLYVMLADATGHGLPAAVCLLPAITVFYSLAKRDIALKEMAEEINRQLLAALPTGHFLAAGLFLVDGAACTLEWWLGGMPPVLAFDRAGRLAKRLSANHLPLGVAPLADAVTEVESFSCADSHQYLLYTDGVVEATDPADEPYGEARLIAAFGAGAEGERLAAARDDLLRHLAGRPAGDDVSLVLLDCRPICQRGCAATACRTPRPD